METIDNCSFGGDESVEDGSVCEWSVGDGNGDADFLTFFGENNRHTF